MGRVQITFDGFRPYIRAIDDAFGAGVDYAMLVKSYGTSVEDGAGTYHPKTLRDVKHYISLIFNCLNTGWNPHWIALVQYLGWFYEPRSSFGYFGRL